MKHLALSTLVLGALSVTSVVAVPSHAHQRHHQHHAEKKRQAGGSWDDADNYTGVNWSTLDWSRILGTPPTSTPVATSAEPSTTVAASVASSATPTATASSDSGSSSSSSSSGSTSFGAVSDPIGDPTSVTYCGNQGVPAGSNMLVTDEATADTFQYVNKITNNLGSTCHWIQWNMCLNSVPNTGAYGAPALSVDIADGETVYIAHDVNTQGAGCCSDGTKNSYAAWNCPWLEFNWANAGTQWSAFDFSTIQATDDANQAMSCTACDQSSVNGQSGSSYQSDTQANGLGVNCPEGPVTLVTTLG